MVKKVIIVVSSTNNVYSGFLMDSESDANTCCHADVVSVREALVFHHGSVVKKSGC